jgi:hypothetical protein
VSHITPITGGFRLTARRWTLIRRFGLIDTWSTSDTRPLYTHYTQHGATRIDRLYTSPYLRPLKQSAAIISEALTDHHASLVRLRLNVPQVQWGRGYWKLNASLLQEDTVLDRFRRIWCMWRLKQGPYPDPLMWWDKYIKKATGRRRFFIHEGQERAREERDREGYYYSCL